MSAAQKSESPAATGLSAKQTTNIATITPAKQRLATLRARAAMAGIQLVVFPDECTGETVFIVSRWNLTRQLESLPAAEKWLDMVTGAKK